MPPVKRPEAAERLVWAVDQLAVQPCDRLLEIGCGHGVAVTLVCQQLDTGHIHAVDRSALMIAAATKRNARYVSEGKATFQIAPLDRADFGTERFDTIFGVHIGVFLRGEPAEELATIRERLVPG